MYNKKFLYSMVLMFCLISLVSAVPPFQSTKVADNGLEIEATNSLYLEADANHTFHFRVYNASNNAYISPDDVTCSMGILDNYGDYVYNKPDVNNLSFRFDVLVLGGNFSEVGVYHKGINCLLDDGTAGAVLTQSFEITENGKENPEGVVILGFILLMLAIFMFVTVYLIRVVGLMIEGNVDILDIGYAWGLFFGVLGLNLFAGIYLGNAEVTEFLELFIKILAFPLVVVPVLAFFLSLFRAKKEKKRRADAW